MSTANQGVLTLIAPLALEEDLVDFFLDSENQMGFTSTQVRGHSSQHTGMNLVEQVTGRTQRVKFQILLSETEAKDICQRLKVLFPDAGINYWYINAVMQGRISEITPEP
ncbi:MAG: DUF3240 family protein [Gammaproteobacteria bacterium]|jgi:CRISPR/Cas system-associated protein Csx1|nr:hypothetical protein [Chromatiales bacterium]MDP6414050.1 DUF3240 family protein [Gammaproteobacteria bacterium]MDP6674671.1 DUF3240 family protein [Gammaproteobacteria bacterium]